MSRSIDLPGGQKLSLPDFSALRGFLSAEDAAQPNAAIERAFSEYEKYLRDVPAMVNR